MKRTWILVLAFGAAACSDGTGPEGDALGRSEAILLAGNLIVSSESVAAGSMTAADPVPPNGIEAVPIEFTHDFQGSRPCPAGGTVSFDLQADGVSDEETGTFELELTGTQTHADCGYPQEGRTIRVSGAPNLQFTASLAAVNGVPSAPFTFGILGAVDWSDGDDRSGRCEIMIDAVTDFGARQRTVDARVCGHTFTHTFTWQQP